MQRRRVAPSAACSFLAATGLTNASCSTIRRGLTVPHPGYSAVLAGTA
jgi:hypothetical protein